MNYARNLFNTHELRTQGTQYTWTINTIHSIKMSYAHNPHNKQEPSTQITNTTIQYTQNIAITDLIHINDEHKTSASYLSKTNK
jgi:hypothetical protein